MVEALLHIGDWVHARALIDRLPPFFAVSHQPVAEAICRVLHHIIEPIYKRSVTVRSLYSYCTINIIVNNIQDSFLNPRCSPVKLSLSSLHLRQCWTVGYSGVM